MKIGSLRHRVTLQEYAGSADSYGAITEEWVDVTTVWAEIEPLSGKEFFVAQQVNSQVDIKIRIRYISGVMPQMRVLYGTRTFSIVSVLDIEERHREIHLMCKEVV